MKFTFLLVALLGGLSQPQMNLEQAWAKVQSDRAKFGNIVRGDGSKPEEIKSAIAGLEALKEWCASDGIRDLKSQDGTRTVYFQRNDILVDEMCGYARLKDVGNVVRCLKELQASLTEPDSWTAKQPSGFSFYASSLRNNPFLQPLFPNREIEAILVDLNHRDPEWMMAGTPFSTAPMEKLSMADRVAGLSLIWSEAKYNFANFDLVKDLDWDASYHRFLPLVANEKDTYAYYNLLREFIGLLKDSHTDVALPAFLRVKEAKPALPLGLVEGKVVVTAEPSPDFQKLGLHKGDIVERIDGTDAVEYGRNRWGRLVSSSTPQDRDVRIYTYMLLRGPRDKPATLDVAGADGKDRRVKVARDGSLKGINLPPSEFKILPDGTAYFAFNTSGSSEPSTSFVKHLPEIQKAGRLIIDCRMNDGGNSDVGWDIVSHLVDKTFKAGQWQTRNYRPSFRAWGRSLPSFGGDEFLEPKAPRFDGPVAVICGPITFSAGEDFLAAFKMSKRGPIVGMPSGGSTGQPLSFRLPGGGYARVCTKRDRMGDGTEFVGKGIIPDIRVEPTIAALRNGKDSALEAALRAISSK